MKFRRILSALAVTATLSTASLTAVEASSSASPPPIPGTASQIAALVSASTTITHADTAVQSQLLSLLLDNWAQAMSIPTNTQCLTATACFFGSSTPTKSIVIWGDSHARMWLPAINPVAVKDNVRLVLLGKDGCPVASINLGNSKYAGCNAVRTTVLNVIAAMKPKVVILADQTSGTGFSATVWKTGTINTIKTLKADGAKVVIIQDVQEFNIAPAVCISLHLASVQSSCAVKNPNPAKVLREPSEQAAANTTSSVYIKTNPWFCTKTKCSPIIGDFLPHFDIGHISASYAAYLSGVMGVALKTLFTS